MALERMITFLSDDDDDISCGDKFNLDVVSNILYQTANYLNEPTTASTTNANLTFSEKIWTKLCDRLGLQPIICKAYQTMNRSDLICLIKTLRLPRDCVLLADSNATLTCDNSFVHKLLVGYCFPILMTICITGNVMNLLVYTVKDLRKSTTVKMLMAKSVVNILFMLFLLPLSLILLNGSRTTTGINEVTLWRYLPYFFFFSNIAGTCAAWLTVMMTLERYLFITYPVRSRLWCTTKNFVCAFVTVFIISCLIYIEIPAVRETESIYCKNADKFVHKFFIRKGSAFQTWERLFYWTTVCWHGILPNVILTFCSVRIAYELIYRSLPTYSDRKQCVTRITMATTICHLVLESPAIVVNIVAAFYGPVFMNTNYIMCVCHVMTNFASQLNASICCLIYMSCSDKYRSILITRLKNLFSKQKHQPKMESTEFNSRRLSNLHNTHLINSDCHTQLDDVHEATSV